MTEIIINHTPLSVKEYKGKRVVTFKDIDTVHGRSDGTARKRFHQNKAHFIEGEDYYKAKCSEVRPFYGQTLPNGFNPNADVILITETGYLMLVKSFRDDLAWQIQRQLVNAYFREQHIHTIPHPVQDTSDEIRRIVQTQRKARELSLLHRLSAQASIKQAEADIAKAELMDYIVTHADLADTAELKTLGLEDPHASKRI